MHATPPPRPPAIYQPYRPFRSAAATIQAAAVSAAQQAVLIRSSAGGFTSGPHLGERQRVNLYRSRGGGKRSRRSRS